VSGCSRRVVNPVYGLKVLQVRMVTVNQVWMIKHIFCKDVCEHLMREGYAINLSVGFDFMKIVEGLMCPVRIR